MSQALGWTAIHFLWQGSVIAAALALLLTIVRTARLRYLIACGAMLAMLLSVAITLLHFLPPKGGVGQTAAAFSIPAVRPLLGNDSNVNHLRDFAALIPWLGPAWLAGVSLFYLRYAAGWLNLRGFERRGAFHAPAAWQRTMNQLVAELQLSRTVLLLESLLADTPVVLRHFRPVILVPLGFLTGLPAHQVEAILLHELTHIRRCDYLVNVCQRLVEGLLFYHPAVWWISGVMRNERENCCDDMVVLLRGDAHGYAAALTALEQNRLHQQQLAVAANGGNLMKRVKRLLYPKAPSGLGAPALMAAVLLAASAMLLVAWQSSPAPGSATAQTEQKVGPWQKWLDEDVIYIISDQEKEAFERLKTDDERQQFVEQFWARRDPTPNTPENEFKEEHYRRIAYANNHYAARIPGWKTDRGRIYILYGPPDEIDSHPAGGSYERPSSEGGGNAMTYPFEDWGYHHFAGVGNLVVEFIDPNKTGEFRMTLDMNEKYKKP